MVRNKWRIGMLAFLCLMGVTAGSLLAQAPQGGRGGRGGGGDVAVLPARQLKPGLFLLTGAGANTLVRVTPEGLIVVDTKNPGEAQATSLLEQIKAISPLPVKYVINTQHHPDHTGNNGKFVDAGATVIGSEPMKNHMATEGRTSTLGGRPTVTFAKDHVLKFGGAEVHAHFFGRGHTGGDTMVYFPDAKVVMVSDHMTDTSPIVDWANGGSWLEWSKALEGVLKLDFEIAIQGRGEPKTRAEVQAFKTKVDLLTSRTSDAIKAGATKEALPMQVKTDDLAPWTLNNAAFFNNLYDELKK
jgi:cyclase